MKVLRLTLVAVLMLASAHAGNETLDSCEPFLWSSLLEEWATTPEHSGRHGRVMSLPPTKGYYVSDRIDLMPPPPPPPSYQQGPHAAHPSHRPPPPSGYSPYDEWQASPPPPPPAGGKIVNRPPNPYKDKFKPSYPPPSPNHPIPLQPQSQSQQPQQHYQQQQQRPGSNAADRVDAAPPSTPQKQVSETDLYLLSAIEKLVYRVDLMEKRLRKMEETMHYLVAGKDTTPEPCASNFTRVGSGCYYFSPDAGDWKAASLRCRKMKTHLLEIDGDDEKRTMFSSLLANKKHKGQDWWTGGLNPGLLWIWSHSARAVVNNSTSNSTIVGEGRCLALVHDPARATYAYRGQDCALRHHFVCEMPEQKAKLSNEIERVARELRTVGGGARKAKIMWSDHLANL
ncbi:hypothetical protein ABMA28_011654 [Loxostege sticticalis]|uniref:C-type lectin domain-containing protein n=1 Tax=Loxostege sticticalis TaxID=481309 RepID=A0ABD0TK26_LOXSC